MSPTGQDADDAQRLIGRILAGRYEVRSVLGRGGMGIVYVGRHITVNRPVAIKVLRRDLARSAQAAARFHREAQAAAAGGSEHIVEVFDFGYSDEGDAFLVMELLEGEDLGRLIRRGGPLPEARALEITRQIARALSTAHAKGIIHRDLKSENVFVLRRGGADFVKLVDFGISKMAEVDEGAGPMTLDGVLMGTPHYMAPEQAVGDVVPDHRIDVYSLGCILFEMLTGRVPFSGRNPVEVVFKHVHEAPPPPSQVRAEPGAIAPETDAVVLRALAKDRDARFASAADLLAALPGVAPGAEGAIAPRTSAPSNAGARASASGGGLDPTPIAPAERPTTGAAEVGRARGPGRKSTALIVGGTALVVATAVVGWARLSRHGANAASVSQPSRAASVDAGAASPAVAAPVVPDVTEARLEHAALAPEAGAGVVDAVSAPAEAYSVEIHVAPRAASIVIDGVAVGEGDARRVFTAGSRHRIEVVADGYERFVEDLVVDRPLRRAVRLARAPRAAARGVPGLADGGSPVASGRDAGGGSGPAEPTGVDPSDELHGNPYEVRRAP